MAEYKSHDVFTKEIRDMDDLELTRSIYVNMCKFNGVDPAFTYIHHHSNPKRVVVTEPDCLTAFPVLLDDWPRSDFHAEGLAAFLRSKGHDKLYDFYLADFTLYAVLYKGSIYCTEREVYALLGKCAARISAEASLASLIYLNHTRGINELGF